MTVKKIFEVSREIQAWLLLDNTKKIALDVILM